jgi:hypothetical protein
MKAMMKQMGLEGDVDMKDEFDEEEEYMKVLKGLGVDPNKNEDEDILAMLNNEAYQNDEDILKSIQD